MWDLIKPVNPLFLTGERIHCKDKHPPVGELLATSHKICGLIPHQHRPRHRPRAFHLPVSDDAFIKRCSAQFPHELPCIRFNSVHKSTMATKKGKPTIKSRRQIHATVRSKVPQLFAGSRVQRNHLMRIRSCYKHAARSHGRRTNRPFHEWIFTPIKNYRSIRQRSSLKFYVPLRLELGWTGSHGAAAAPAIPSIGRPFSLRRILCSNISELRTFHERKIDLINGCF